MATLNMSLSDCARARTSLLVTAHSRRLLENYDAFMGDYSSRGVAFRQQTARRNAILDSDDTLQSCGFAEFRKNAKIVNVHSPHTIIPHDENRVTARL